jgi:hypothetical protein
MSGPRAPVPGARLGVGLAVRLLPTRRDRERYYCEFVAELYGMPPGTQLRQVVGMVSQPFALRAALGAARFRGIEEGLMEATVPAGQRFRCRYLRWHHWQTIGTPDGERYVACSVCKTDHSGWGGANRNTLGGMAG